MHRLNIRCLGRFIKRGVMGRLGRRGGGRGVGGLERGYFSGRYGGELGGVGGVEEIVVHPFAVY